MKVLVTGASGFVGRNLCRVLIQKGYEVIATVRERPSLPLATGVKTVKIGEFSGNTAWKKPLQGVRSVVHLAARTHVMRETDDNPETAYQRMNVDVTRRLAEECVRSSARRIVLMSSIKVNGESTNIDRPYMASDPPAPEDPYGRTKLHAERELARATEGTDTDFVILRSPLIYGAGVKGNFAKLMCALAAGQCLPLGSISNCRSLVFVENLCSALIACLESDRAANRTFLVSDGEDLSTQQLARRLAGMLGKPACLLPVPVPLLKIAGKVSGNNAAVSRLTGSLRVDSSLIRDELSWSPPFSVDEGLERTAAWFNQQAKKQKLVENAP